MTTRRYLHPIQPAGKLRIKDYRVTQKGVTANGTKLKSFESINPAVAHGYKYGVQMEAPGQPSVMAFGSYNDINDLASAIQNDLPSVEKSLRPLGQSQFYSLNGSLATNKPTHTQPPKSEADSYITAQKVFPGHDNANGLTDTITDEKRALKKHQRKLAESKQLYPSSDDGKAAIEAELNPQASSPSTLATGPVEAEGA